MNQKINTENGSATSQNNEFPKWFLFILVLTVALYFSIIILLNYFQNWIPDGELKTIWSALPQLAFVPWQLPAGKTISNGLFLFSGRSLASPNIYFLLTTLASIIFCYICIPTVFFFQWRKRRLKQQSIFSIDSFSLSSIGYSFSVLIISILTITMLTSGWMGYQTFQGMKKTQAIQSEKEGILDAIALITMEAHQYMLVPKKYDGGEGSYEGFSVTSVQLKSQDVAYTCETKKDEIIVTAQSLTFPSGKIIKMIDNKWYNEPSQCYGVFN
jgi:hypothetical protein